MRSYLARAVKHNTNGISWSVGNTKLLLGSSSCGPCHCCISHCKSASICGNTIAVRLRDIFSLPHIMHSEPEKDILYKVHTTIFIGSEWEKNLECAHDLYLYYVEVHANEKMHTTH